MWRLAVAVLVCGMACAGPQSPQVSSATPAVSASVVAAPSSSPPASTSPRPSAVASGTFPTPTPRPGSTTLLFAALKAEGAVNSTDWNTVVIAGLDGYEGDKTTFKPMAIPYVGCAGAVIPMSAHVVAGKVYYASGDGVIRSMAPGGQVTTVATFPLTSTQQMFSFAVKPDATRLLAAIFTLPPKPVSGNPCDGTSPRFAAGDFTLDVYTADIGGTSRLLYHRVLATSSASPLPNVMAFAGWSALGPFGTFPTEWATQGGGPQGYFGKPVHIDAVTGDVLADVSDPSCHVWDIAVTGDYVCTPGGSVGDISVRHADGTEVWGERADPLDGGYSVDFLSPMGGRVVALGSTGGSRVVCWGACNIPITGSFMPQGWLDDLTVIGNQQPGGNLVYVRIDATHSPLDLTFKGLFVGTIRL